jgi:hypothetical protein
VQSQHDRRVGAVLSPWLPYKRQEIGFSLKKKEKEKKRTCCFGYCSYQALTNKQAKKKKMNK